MRTYLLGVATVLVVIPARHWPPLFFDPIYDPVEALAVRYFYWKDRRHGVHTPCP